MDRWTFFADVVKASFEDFERADVVEASCVRKTWRSFLSLLALMSHLCQSVKGKMIFWRLDPVWPPGYLNRRVESNDDTVLPKFDPVWSPQMGVFKTRNDEMAK